MTIREFKKSDVQEIEKIHSRFHQDGFNMPEIANAYATAIVEDNDKILGFGMVRDITESIMILDLSLPLTTKTEVLTELIKESVRKSHHPFIHSFVENQIFDMMLKKRYGYKPCKGAALCLET